MLACTFKSRRRDQRKQIRTGNVIRKRQLEAYRNKKMWRARNPLPPLKSGEYAKKLPQVLDTIYAYLNVPFFYCPKCRTDSSITNKTEGIFTGICGHTFNVIRF
jgi:hypothetical protein